MKRYLSVPLLLWSFVGTAQQHQAVDFFFPRDGVNKTLFENPEASYYKGVIWYLNEGDTLFTVNNQFISGTHSSSVTSEYLAEGPIIRIISELRTNDFEKKNAHFFTHRNIFLKIPSSTEPEEWNYTNQNGQKINCLAELNSKVINGDTLESVKVTKAIVRGKKVTNNVWVEHYVRGVGYTGTDKDGRTVESLTEQEFSNDVKAIRGMLIANGFKEL